MLISVQFPLADSRGFVANTGRLRKPGWPLPTPDEEFVRTFGPIRIRPRGGLAGWIGEHEICEATRSIRLTECLTLKCSRPSKALPLRVAFRRFFYDGLAVCKFELGLATVPQKSLMVNERDIKTLVDAFLRLKVRIREPNGAFVESPLLKAGKHLARSYLSATTRNGHPDEPETWYIRAGTPLLFLECNIHEKIHLPYFARHVELPSKYNFKLDHCLVPLRGDTVRMWFLDEHSDASINYYSLRYGTAGTAARRLRIYLQRLHAEHECLRLVLRNLMAKTYTVVPRSSSSDALQQYFNEATRRIGILESKATNQFDDEICEIARESMNILNPGQIDALNRVLSNLDLRKNILRKLEDYSNKWHNITIIEKVEENYMGDVFKDINQSIISTRGSIAEGIITLRTSGNEEVANAISRIDELIADAPEEDLHPEKKKECTDLLNSITEETLKHEPNKNVLRALGTSLLTILTNVEPLAKAGKTAFDIMKTLWS